MVIYVILAKERILVSAEDIRAGELKYIDVAQQGTLQSMRYDLIYWVVATILG